MSAQPAQAIQPPRLYRLSEAVRTFFPHGGISVGSLRTEARAGRLRLIRIANKDFVTAEAIQDMLEECTCRASESRHASTSGSASDATANGSSLMERERSAQAALQQTLLAHRRR